MLAVHSTQTILIPMPHKLVALYKDRPVGRYHGAFASHVAVLALANGRFQCRGWGLRVDAEAALERAKRHETGLQYAAVHETEVDKDPSVRLMRRMRRDVPPTTA